MNKHIVNTDDEISIRKVINIFLKKDGYKVSSCRDGNELLNLLKEQSDSIDLVLLDIKMPGLSGFDVLEIMSSTYPSIPVVMLTAFNDLETGLKAMRLGAKDYLAKPVSRDTLASCVERVINDAQEEKEKVIATLQNLSQQKELEGKLEEALTRLDSSTRATLLALSETIEQKDSYTKGHCQRVSNIAMAIAHALDFSDERLRIIEGGALLHDIGKIGISEEILNKSTSLTNEEYEIIKMHPVYGERIISHMEMFQSYKPIVRSHHERLDGKGYPDGLKGDQIPLEVRIITIADAFDSMTSRRAYRDALPVELAIEEIKLFSGSQFDPALVNLFIDQELFLL